MRQVQMSPPTNVYLDGSVQLAWEPMLHAVVEHKLSPKVGHRNTYSITW